MELEKIDEGAEKVEKYAKKVASGTSRARVNFSLAGATFLAAAVGTGLLADKMWMPAGVACFLAAILFFILVRRLIHDAAVDLPKLKGASPFGSADGDIFSGLGREGKVSDLVDAVISGDKAVVFVYGPSGVGKTSVVNAGLRDALAKGQFNVIYVSASGDDFEQSIVRQSSATLPEGEPVPTNMEELITSRGKLVQVVVIDDVDLAPDLQKIMAWMVLALTQGHPFRRVFVLTMEAEEYYRNWNNKEWSRPRAVLPVQIEKFERATAKNTVRVLCEKAQLPVADSVLDDIVDDLSSMSSEAKVSPLALSVIIRRIAEKSGRHFGKADYRSSGYATGILGAYVEESLKAFARGNAENVLRALARQANAGTESFRAGDLGSSTSGMPELPSLLMNLSLPEVHILYAKRDRTFRLLDDWAPALKAAAGSPNPDVAYLENHILGKYKWWYEGRVFGGRGLLRWLSEGTSLLTSDDLARFDRHKSEFQFGADQNILSYISRSRAYRKWQKVAFALGVVVAVFAVGLLYWMAQGWRAKSIEEAWGLPTDFARLEGQLEELAVACPVNDLKLLPRNLKTLEVNCENVKTISGAPSTLRRLVLAAGITSLNGLPRTVQKLDIHATHIPGIEGLSNVRLTALDASGVPISNMKLIPGTVTDLKLSSPSVESLEGLPDHLTDLSLVGTSVTSLKGVPNMVERLTLFLNAKLTIDSLPNHLVWLETDIPLGGVALPSSLDTIVFSNLGNVRVPKGIKNVELKNSRSIDLKILSTEPRKSEIVDAFPESLETLRIDDLKYPVLLGIIPKGVHHLKVKWFEDATFAQLPPQLIDLDLSDSQDALTSLEGIGPVKELDISSTKVPDFRDVPDSVTTLRFELCRAFRLSKFPAHLAKLYLGGCSDLDLIDNLPSSLTELDIHNTKISHLPALPDGITKLDISNTEIRGVLPRLPENLTELTLHMGQIDRFESIPRHLKILKFRDFEPKK